ncbi:MAG: hypothetical protein GY711_14895 [bacterium]|nr:hypothetical protein [bacterium]
MKTTRQIVVLLALVSLFAFAGAHAQDPVRGGDTKASNPVRPGKRVTVVPTKFSIKVTGIPVEAIHKVVKQLLETRRDVYGCTKCSSTSRRAGDCESCKLALEKKEPLAVFEAAKLSIDRRYLDVTLVPGRWAKLSEIEAVLAEFGGKVKRADFRLPGYSRIGLSHLDESKHKSARAALVSAKVVKGVTLVQEDEVTWALPRVLKEKATLGEVEAAVLKTVEASRVVDVHWIVPCSSCTRAGTVGSGCRTCW